MFSGLLCYLPSRNVWLCLVLRKLKEISFKVESLISELQSQLWQWHLRALPHRPLPRKELGIPPGNTRTPGSVPEPRADGHLSLWNGQLERMALGLHSSSKFQYCLFSQTNSTVYFCVMFWGCAVYCYPQCAFFSKFVMLLVSGTFFFPTSEIN